MSTNVRKLRDTKERIASKETSKSSPRTKQYGAGRKENTSMAETGGKDDTELNVLRKQIQDLTKQIQQITQVTHKQSNEGNTNNANDKSGTYSWQIEARLPQFRNEIDDNPQKFLNEFRDYCQIKNIPKKITLLLIGTILEDRAKIWFDANKEYITTLEEFESKFKKEFFSIEQQIELRNKWNNRKYRQVEGSLKTYFLKAKTEASYLMQNTGEYEINHIIISQLPINVRKILVTINVTIQKLFYKRYLT